MKINYLLFICLISMMLLGCSRDDKTAYVPVKLSDKDSDEGKADITNDDKANADNSSVDNESLEDIEQGSFADDVNQIYVYICGEIKRSGVYKVSPDCRLFELVEMAGGLTDSAADYLNLAKGLYDGEKIDVLSKDEYESLDDEVKESLSYQGGFYEGLGNATGNDSNAALVTNDELNALAGNNDTKININTADVDELTKLPGIGDSKANLIIAYRKENGLFENPEDIKNVSGIGDASYEKIKELIKIN